MTTLGSDEEGYPIVPVRELRTDEALYVEVGAQLLGSILDEFECSPECPRCAGTGHVCERHPDRPWGPMICAEPVPPVEVGAYGECWCGVAGMPCPSIAEARSSLS